MHNATVGIIKLTGLLDYLLGEWMQSVDLKGNGISTKAIVKSKAQE